MAQVLETLAAGGKVLVHCMRGLHRSGTFAGILMGLLCDSCEGELGHGLHVVFLARGHTEGDIRRVFEIVGRCGLEKEWGWLQRRAADANLKLVPPAGAQPHRTSES